MNKMKIGFLILIVLGIVGYNYIYKSHRNIQLERPDYTLFSNDILDEFQLNLDESTNKYLNKIIIIEGEVTNLERDFVMLDDRIVCYNLDSKSLNLNTTVKIKGRFIGYDELLEELKLDQCIIIKQ
ncbi:OB-fold protein [Urechidicola vernalis]|uniref:tRNA_anti-like n=1 Tax=Urechidicola vernalis TaxID=3075600 RepID=A0ABU2Y811_9FLAO|nr:hypothetical protein [Urechidicola sp. P050]MDT0553847.1 hypothetical protein [Urechidicola sp. P050]